MRSIIKNSKTYRIRGVPTLFVMQDDKLSIFEGEKVYRWLLSITKGEEEPEQNPELVFDGDGSFLEEPEDNEEEDGVVYGQKTLKNPTGVSAKDRAAQLQREAQATLGFNYE